MQLTLDTPTDQLRQAVENSKRRLTAERGELRKRMGRVLLPEIEASLKARAEGLPDAGITWAPLDPDWVARKRARGLSQKIGIATGRLMAGANWREEAGRLVLSFAAAHAAEFAVKRPLLPEALPDDWEAAAEDEAVAWSDAILVEEFSKDKTN